MNVIGSRVGPFDVLELLGAGSGGRVHKALDNRTGRLVALKFFTPDASEAWFKRFRREVKVLKTLADRHVVPYVDADLDGTPAYLAMALIEGRSLLSVIRERREEQGSGRSGGFPVPEVHDWALDIAGGLAAAHRVQIVHRDLKPANVMIDNEGHAVVVDFGLARVEQTSNPQLTGSQEIVGTLQYLPPEQILGGPVGSAADVYQWGLIVHELLVGTLPYPTFDPLGAVHYRSTRGVPPVTVGHPLLAKVVHGALATDASQRLQHGSALLSALEEAGSGKRRAESTRRDQGSRPAASPLRAPVETETPPSDLTRQVSPYQILRQLGKGGMGTVYEGRHPTTGERVAIKQIDPLIAASPEGAQRFRREAQILARIRCPRIVRLLDYRFTSTDHFLIMEYLEGETLAQRLRRTGALRVQPALDLMHAVAEGVAELHRHEVVHRDLKPANIMLTSRSGPRLLDLGIARDLSLTQLTVPGYAVGTPLYAAPEMLAGGTVSYASDVFQLGLIFYEVLTGRSDSRAPDAVDTLRGFLCRERSLRRTEGEDPLEDSLAFFRKATALDPARRFAGGGEALAALARIKDGLRHLSTVASRGTPGPAPDEAARNSRIAAAGGLAVVGRVISFAFAGLVLAVAILVLTLLPEITRRMFR